MATLSELITAKNTICKPGDTFIAVMGVTGAGKSTFISKCCDRAISGVGHGLQSVTQDVGIYTYYQDGKPIHLIDTPGFDDTNKTDSDVLRDLAYYLTKSYNFGIRLTGIVYLHPITHNRMTGSAFKNLRTFRKLCGSQSMASVILATTMWENVNPPQLGEEREKELTDTPEFWGDMKREGSQVMQHRNSRESAVAIISALTRRNTTTVLGLQSEMVDQNKTLENTEAGREVDREMAEERDRFERRLKETGEELKAALEDRDQDHVEQMLKEQKRYEAKLDQIQKGRDELRIGLEKLISAKDKQHMAEMAEVREDLRKQVEEYEKFKEFAEAQKQAQEQREAELQERMAESDKLAFLVSLGAKEIIEESERKEAEMRQREGQREQDELRLKVQRMELEKNRENSPTPSSSASFAPPPYQQYSAFSTPPPPSQVVYAAPQAYMAQPPQTYNAPPPPNFYPPPQNDGPQYNSGFSAGAGAMTGAAVGGAMALGLCNVM